ncbi:MAG: DUF4281 domain-containing protein [Sphingopyxis sp.]|nr:DUF4281 domain-containing protein [Sphingopyxis sp.]
MGWDMIFSLTNGIAIIGWLILWFAPRKPALLSLVMYLGVGLLCLIYTVSFGSLLLGDAVVGGEGGFSYDIAGIRALFASDAGIVIGWTHYLAFDLFTGLWIARDADNKGFGRVAQVPILLATLMAGPVGLLIWLVLREPAARRKYGRGR